MGAAVLTILFAGYFATVQNVWIDESTQLLGSGLPFARMLRWLAGGFEPLGVPGDRMPPGSYVVDWVCAHSGCSSPLPFRTLHILAMAVGVFLTTSIAGRRYGAVAGVVTGLFLALLPQTIMVGAEIRAYPIFFLLTAVQLHVLSHIFDRYDLDGKGIALLVAVSLLSTYTHFFGLIASSALFFGLFVAQVRSRQCILLVGGGWLIFLLLSLGLAPFVGGARAISDASTIHPGMGAVAVYLSRIVGSAPMLLTPWIMAVFFVCFALLIAALAVSYGRRIIRSPRGLPLDYPVALLLAVASGVGVTVVASLVVHGFDPMKPSYSIWLVPLLALLAGIAAAEARALTGVAAAMLIALLIVQANFLRHAGLFVHGPERAIADVVGPDADGTAIVYEGEAWAYAYFPLIYRYGGALDHYHIDPSGAPHAIAAGGDPNASPADMRGLSRYRRILLVDVTAQTGSDLRHLLQGQRLPGLMEPPAVNLTLFPADAWRTAGGLVRPGLYWLQLAHLERKP